MNDKKRLCKCGNELGLFGFKCDSCRIKDRPNKKIAYRGSSSFLSGDACSHCHKECLSGQNIVIYSGGIAHRSCWLEMLEE